MVDRCYNLHFNPFSFVSISAFLSNGMLSKRGENRRADYPRKGKIIGKLGKR